MAHAAMTAPWRLAEDAPGVILFDRPDGAAEIVVVNPDAHIVPDNDEASELAAHIVELHNASLGS